MIRLTRPRNLAEAREFVIARSDFVAALRSNPKQVQPQIAASQAILAMTAWHGSVLSQPLSS